MALRLQEPALNYMLAAAATLHRTIWSPGYCADDSTFYFRCLAKGIKRMLNTKMDLEILHHCNDLMLTSEIVRSGDIITASSRMDKFAEVLATNGSRYAARVLPSYRVTCDLVRENLMIINNRSEVLSISLQECAVSLEHLMYRWVGGLLRWNDSSWVRRYDLSDVSALLTAWEHQFNGAKDSSPLSNTLELHFCNLVCICSQTDGLQWRLKTLGNYALPLDSRFSRIAPAFTIATTSPEATTRKAALNILKSLDADESWHSDIAYLVALALQPVYETLEENVHTVKQMPAIKPVSATLNDNRLVVQYILKPSNKRQQTHTSFVDIPSEYRIRCFHTKWPLEGIVKSLGYQRVDLDWSPYMTTESVIDLRLRALNVVPTKSMSRTVS